MLCLVEKQTKVRGSQFVRRTAEPTDIAPTRFSIVKRRLNKDTYIHCGSRLILKPLTYHDDHHVLPTPEGMAVPVVAEGVARTNDKIRKVSIGI